MTTTLLFSVLQVILALFLAVLILVQSKGKGLSSMIGSTAGFYRSRRGLEQAIFVTTIIVAILLTANSLLLVFLN